MSRITICILAILINVGYGKLANKIYSGDYVDKNEFPYIVSVGAPHFGSCSGSIITREHILTSAHCVSPKKNIVEPNVSVLSGTNDLLDIKNGQIHDVLLIILYDKYDPPRESNHDIAILKLADPIEFSLNQQPIALPNTDFIPHGEQVKIGGWGILISNSNVPSRYLNQIFLTVLSDDECQQTYPSEIDLSLFCGVTSHKIGGITEGDSGGPVVYNNEIIGIVTSAYDVNDEPSVSIFTRTWLYKSWITNVINH